MKVAVTIPFGEGEAVVTGYFSVPVPNTWGSRMEDAVEGCPGEFDICSFVVGGVDILEEVVDTYVQSVKILLENGKQTRQIVFMSKWEYLSDLCYDKVYGNYLKEPDVEEPDELVSEFF